MHGARDGGLGWLRNSSSAVGLVTLVGKCHIVLRIKKTGNHTHLVKRLVRLTISVWWSTVLNHMVLVLLAAI